MNIVEVWTEKHQFVLWCAGMLATFLLSLFAMEIRAVFTALPRGMRRVREAYRVATLYRLEAYKDDPAILIRTVLANCAISLLIVGVIGTISMAKFRGHYAKGDPLALYLTEIALEQFAQIHLALYAILSGCINIGIITLTTVWLYRSPDQRIRDLQSLPVERTD